jgi:hypothetical protein
MKINPASSGNSSVKPRNILRDGSAAAKRAYAKADKPKSDMANYRAVAPQKSKAVSRGPKSSYAKASAQAKTATLKKFAKVGPSALAGANSQRAKMYAAKKKAK